MRSRRVRMANGLVTAVAIAWLTNAPAAAQQNQPVTAAASPKSPAKKTLRIASRMPWGDPDLQGVYTNNDESGIPLERPNQFEGKRLEDGAGTGPGQLPTQPGGLRLPIARNLGGIPGTNPVHWFENFGAKNSR